MQPYDAQPPQWHDPAAAGLGPPPSKLFREPAATASVGCLACGGPISLRGFGAVERVVCPYCGSALEPSDSGGLALLQRAARQRQPTVLPLHARGTLEGIEWEIIGIAERGVEEDGITYAWQEFLLFNPYKGFRWLVYTRTDGQWQIARAADGVAIPSGDGVTYDGRYYAHVEDSHAQVLYVEGEFTWRVEVGDEADMRDYASPPHGFGIERDAHEVNYTISQWIAGDEVWRAFRQPGSPPPVLGVGPLQPNPWLNNRRFFFIAFPALIVAWIVISFLQLSAHERKERWSGTADAVDAVITDEIDIGTPGRMTTVEARMASAGLDNNWVYGQFALVNVETEEAFLLGVENSHYAGVEDGEAWVEASGEVTAVATGVPGGKYALQVTFETDPARPAPREMKVALAEGVTVMRYFLFALGVILLFPLVNFIGRLIFEARRSSSGGGSGEGLGLLAILLMFLGTDDD